MGCWNGTCGLSGLPITAGTEIYVFPIVETHRDSFCYTTALYRPSVVPFRAEYNDYGAGEDCSGPALELLMNGIRDQLVEMEIGKNRYHDIAVKREIFDVDMFFEACHEHRLQFYNPFRQLEDKPQNLNVFFTMIRKDVVDRLWNEWSFDLWKDSDVSVPDGFESDNYYIKNVTYAKLAELIPQYMEQEESTPLSSFCVKSLEKYDNEQLKKMEHFYRESALFSPNGKHILSRHFGHVFSGFSSGYSNIADVKEAIIEKYFNGDKETAYELMREVLVGMMVNGFMEHTRKIWTPPMHQGSQSESYNEYRLMNCITADIMNAREREFDE